MNSPPFITCQELIGFIGDYLDHRLTPAQAAEFERHLRVCPSCVNYLDAYERTVALARSAGGSGVEVGPVPPRLVEAIKRARRDG